MGIIKPQTAAVISGITQPQLRKRLEFRCKQINVPLYLLNRDFKLQPTVPKLLGDFQRQNFTLAYEASRILLSKQFSQYTQYFTAAAKRAAQTAFIPGRMEIVSTNPLTILDGAHNAAKMRALITSLKHLYPEQKWIVVLALKSDKNYRQVLRLLEPVTASFVFTQFHLHTDLGRNLALDPRLLKNTSASPALVEQNPLKAVRQSSTHALQHKLPILITGSLYLVGEVRSIWHPVRP